MIFLPKESKGLGLLATRQSFATTLHSMIDVEFESAKFSILSLEGAHWKRLWGLVGIVAIGLVLMAGQKSLMAQIQH